MRHKVALTLQFVNKIPVRVTIEVKTNKYYFHAEHFITYFKVGVLLGSQCKRKKRRSKKKKHLEARLSGRDEEVRPPLYYTWKIHPRQDGVEKGNRCSPAESITNLQGGSTCGF